MSQLAEFLQRKAQELARELNHSDRTETTPPVVELYLTGVLPFDRRSLELKAIERLVQESFAPLIGVVKTQIQSSDYPIERDTLATRGELEQRVLEGLFERDTRYSRDSNRWARAAIALKQMVLAGTPADTLLDELAAYLRQTTEEA